VTDIYNAIATNAYHLSNEHDETLMKHRDCFDDAEIAVTSALKLIGNLILEAEQSDCYSNEESRRDLSEVGRVLRSLPRLAQALNFNAREIDFELKRRKGVSQ